MFWGFLFLAYLYALFLIGESIVMGLDICLQSHNVYLAWRARSLVDCRMTVIESISLLHTYLVFYFVLRRSGIPVEKSLDLAKSLSVC